MLTDEQVKSLIKNHYPLTVAKARWGEAWDYIAYTVDPDDFPDDWFTSDYYEYMAFRDEEIKKCYVGLGKTISAAAENLVIKVNTQKDKLKSDYDGGLIFKY